MAAAEALHLTQEKLGPRDTEILVALQNWISRAVFDADNVCIDKDIGRVWASNLGQMDFIQKVTSEGSSPIIADLPKFSSNGLVSR